MAEKKRGFLCVLLIVLCGVLLASPDSYGVVDYADHTVSSTYSVYPQMNFGPRYITDTFDSVFVAAGNTLITRNPSQSWQLDFNGEVVFPELLVEC